MDPRSLPNILDPPIPCRTDKGVTEVGPHAPGSCGAGPDDRDGCPTPGPGKTLNAAVPHVEYMPPETRIIAEVGPNHHGDWDIATEMIAAAAESGADAVKFQSYRADQVDEDHPERGWFEQVEVPDDVHFELRATAEEYGIAFLSSPFSVERAKFLVEEVGLDTIKVASSELVNRPMLEYLNDAAETVYLSTGLSTQTEVDDAISQLENVPRLCVMQCTSLYPCPPSEANLDVLETYRERFPEAEIGFSDHTVGLLAAEIAVAKGATVVEKHFTTDRSLPGPDQTLSATPGEIAELVGRIERVETLRGSSDKAPTPGERENVEAFRSRFRNTELED